MMDWPLGAWLLVGGSGGLVAVWAWQRLRRLREDKSLREKGLSETQRRQLGGLWPQYSQLPLEVRQRLDGWAALFLERISFEACGGLERVRDEMRLLVAAQACLLLAGSQSRGFFPRLRSVLLYPGAFRVPGAWSNQGELDEDTWLDGPGEARLGESWHSGSVVLGWEDVVRGARSRDGINLVLHEFAHQLDFDGPGDGAPRLDGFDAQRWQRVFSGSYAGFLERLERGQASVLDRYAATNPAEFFAVSVEAFFERGAALNREIPELYAVLADWFGADPARWGGTGAE